MGPGWVDRMGTGRVSRIRAVLASSMGSGPICSVSAVVNTGNRV
jgi:hypothetical protein